LIKVYNNHAIQELTLLTFEILKRSNMCLFVRPSWAFMWRQWRKSVWASPVKRVDSGKGQIFHSNWGWWHCFTSIYYLFFKVFEFLRLHVFIMLIILKIFIYIIYSLKYLQLDTLKNINDKAILFPDFRDFSSKSSVKNSKLQGQRSPPLTFWSVHHYWCWHADLPKTTQQTNYPSKTDTKNRYAFIWMWSNFQIFQLNELTRIYQLNACF
jgi:hypothetical protein